MILDPIKLFFGKYLALIEIAAAAGALALVVAQHMHVLSLKATIATNAAAYSQRVAEAETATADAERAARTEETRRAAVAQEKVDESQVLVARHAADAASATAAYVGMQHYVATLVAQARRPAANPGPASSSSPAQDAVGMLAELQRRADERAGVLARIADERGDAGSLCERLYDSLTPTASIAP